MSAHAPEGWSVEVDLLPTAGLAMVTVTDPAGRRNSGNVVAADREEFPEVVERLVRELREAA